MARQVPDISRIQRLIGDQSVVVLPEMLERIIACKRAWGGQRLIVVLDHPTNGEGAAQRQG